MSLSYPFNFPTTGGLTKVTWMAKSLVSVNQSEFTGQQEVQRHQGQWWEAVVSVSTLETIDESEDWISFLVGLNGREGTFLMGDPVITAPRGTASGGGLIKGASQTGNTLETDDWGFNQGLLFKAGDLIQLGTAGTSRLHKVLIDAASDGSGNATLEIFPGLRESPVDDSAIVIANPKGLFRLAQDVSQWDMTPPLRYEISFAVMEAF